MKDRDHKNGARVIEVTELGATPDLRERNGSVGDQERLREYEKVVEGLEEMIVVVDRNYRYLIANRAFLKYRDMEREEVVGHAVPEILSQDVFDRVVKPKLDECFQGKVVRYEMDYSYPKIGERVLSISYFPIEGPTGVDRVACVLQDTTQRRQAEELLRQSESQLAEAQHTAHVGSWNCDMQSNILTWSDELYNIYGLKQEEFKPSYAAFLELVHPEDRDFIAKSVEDCLLNHKPFSREERIIRPDGEERIVHFSGNVVCDDKGNPIRMYGACQDVTERKQAEEALRQAEQKYRDMFENAGEGISQSTPDGRFIAANPALARMYGFASPEELIHSRQDISRQLYVDPTRREEFKRQLEQQGAVRGFEYQGFRKDGSKIWVSVNARAVRDARGAILYYEGTTQDIDERKQAEAKSAAFATLARKLNGARTQLDAGRIIAQTAGDLFGWDSCDLNHYDSDRDLVYQMLNIDTIDGRQIEVFGVISGRKPTARGRRVIDHGAELLLREEPVQFDAEAIPFGDRTRPSASIMTVPVRHAARVTDLLSIQSYTPHNYDGAALADLQALADHCGAALNRIRAEQSLYESEERFRQMADHFEDVIWITDRDITKVLYLNPAFERVFRCTCEGAYERVDSFVEVVHPDDRDTVQRMLERQREGDYGPAEYRVVWPDGSVRRLQRRAFPIRNNDGEVYRVAGIVQDITERKQAENALKESEERFRQLSEAAFEAIILHDQGTILEVNQSFCRMYGYERAEVIGKSVLDLALPEFRELLAQKVRAGDTGSYEGPALRKDGTIFRTEIAAKPLHYQGHVVRVAAIRDITEQERNERRQAAQYAVTRVLAESATLAEAIPQLLQVICESLRWKMGEFWRVDDSTNLLRCVETWHAPGLDATAFIEASRQTELAPGVGLPGRVWQSGQPAWIPDVMTDPGFAHAAIAGKLGLHGAVAFPILLGNHTLGLMLFFSRRAPEVDEDLLKMMSAIGSQIGQFTERKRAEEALRESEERYRDLVENSRELICTHDLDGRVLSANRAAAETLGYDSNELLEGKNIRDILAPEVRHEFDEYMARLCKDGATSGIMLVQTMSGERRVWEYYNSLRTEGVAAPIVRGIARDITDSRRVEQALLASEHKYRDIFTFAPVGIYQSLRDGTLTTANKALAEMLAYASVDEFLKVNLADVYFTPDEREKLIREYEDLGYATDLELRWKRKDGSPIWVQMSAHAIKGANGATEYFEGFVRNITERKRAEEALRESEGFRQTIFDSEPECVKVIGRDFTLLDMNPAGLEMIGASSREQVIGQSVLRVIAPEWRNAFTEMHQRVLRGHPVVAEFETCGLDGVRRWMETHAVPLRNSEAAVVGQLAITRDITERRRVEEALRESEERYRDLIENSREFICTHDLDGLILSANRAASEVLGYDLKDCCGKKNYRDLLVPEVRDQFDDYLARIRRDGFASGLTLVQTSSGERRILEYHNTVRTEGVATPIVRGMARDITEQRRAEKALRESEERYRELFENAKDAIYVHDLTGRYTSVNHAAERLTGFTREEILGKHYSNFVAPRDLKHVRTNLCRKLDEENETIYEVDMVTRNGQRVPVEVSSRLIYEKGVAVGVQGTARDITDRKRAQEALRTYSQRLIQAQEVEREKIARELHDEIGQVLTAVRINLQSIQRSGRTGDGVPSLDESIGIVDEALERVRELSIELRPSLLDDLGLGAALRWYVDRYAQRTGIIAELLNGFKEDGRLPRELETACFRIAQEALTNVARHAQAVSVSVQLEHYRERMLLTIIDDGVGFETDDLRKNASAASALGLRGMEERALAVGGYIEIDSGSGRGTRVRATFPLRLK